MQKKERDYLMQKKYATVEMADGTTYTDLRIVYADQIKYAETARRHKWGSPEDDAIRFGGFLAYAAMTRLGHYPSDKGFDEFVAEVADIDVEVPDDEVGFTQ